MKKGSAILLVIMASIIVITYALITYSRVNNYEIVHDRYLESMKKYYEKDLDKIDDIYLEMVSKEEKPIKKEEKEKIYTRIKEESKYNLPYIPRSFEYVKGTWNTGFVIKNSMDGNEFVWIPVRTKDEYIKRNFISRGHLVNQVVDEPLNSEQTYADGVVANFGGFYIGRFEAASEKVRNLNSELTIPIIKINKPVYNFVDFSEAKSLADKLYENDMDCISTLVTGKQWDTACAFLGEEYSYDSTGKGNYSNKLNVTGKNGYKIKNVYDMAGNTLEWINERQNNSNDEKIIRGGAFDDKGNEMPAGIRKAYNLKEKNEYFSFRIALYIK